MLRIKFTAEEVELLRSERFSHPHPRVQMKMEALLLKSQGLSHKEIGDILDVCQETLRGYFEQYMNGGIEGLKVLWPQKFRPGGKVMNEVREEKKRLNYLNSKKWK